MQPTTWYQIDRWITQVRRLAQHARCNSPDFLRPYHLAVLAMALRHQRLMSLNMPRPLESYAARMRLWHAVGLLPPVSVTSHDPQGRFVPLVRLENRNDVGETAKELAAITSTFGADDQTRDAVMTSMMEIMDNCFAHAAIAGPLQGVACAQSWDGGNLAQIAVADAGIGIRASLGENPLLAERLAAGNACELASEFGVTSKPGAGHAGYGLALTRQLLERAGGRLIVMSGDEWVQAHGLKCDSGRLTTPFLGTLAVLEWNTRKPLRLKDVYQSWPLPAGFTDDDLDL